MIRGNRRGALLRREQKSAKALLPGPMPRDELRWKAGFLGLHRFSERILPLDLAVADRWGHVTGICKAKGMNVPAIDGMLAATALPFDLVFVTRNVRDVQVTGVDTLDPWNL